MKMKKGLSQHQWKGIGLSVILALSLAGCQSEPSTPMEAVHSKVLTDKYSASFYQRLNKSDVKAYAEIFKYCNNNRDMPNCNNVMIADGHTFNGIPPDDV